MNKEYKEKLETLQGIDFCNCLKEYIEHNEKLEQENKEQEEYITYWQKETDKRQDKIDKAIEYIKNKQVIDLDYLEKILKGDVDEDRS